MSTPQSAIVAEDGPSGLFLTLYLQIDADTAVKKAAAAFPSLLAELAATDSVAKLNASLAFGSELWARIRDDAPAQLKPFQWTGEGELMAPATGGDLFLHIHSARNDLNYLLARRFVAPLRAWIEDMEETVGFRYLDCRDLTGFIDGTENPQEPDERGEAALIGAEDPAFSAGSYVLAQRFVHRLDQWDELDQAQQEGVIGRTKPDSEELDDEHKPATAHISRVVIEEDGEELEIVRHSMPYGSVSGDSGLFFLAYSRDLQIFEMMLARMFGQSGDGLHDRLMEFTEAVTGAFFFAPSLEVLAELDH